MLTLMEQRKVMRHIKGVEVVSFYISSRQKTPTS